MDTTVTIELAPLARDLGLPEEQLRRTVELLDEGNTVPFITRYRKDRTGGLDEEQIRQVHDRVARARMLAERKRTILKSIESQGKLTEELAAQIERATSTKRLEDLYLPYKPKKQTLATVARERGLEPLAKEILNGEKIAEDLDRRALDFVDIDKGIRSQADALLGVGHLIAEHFSERVELREALRRIVRRTGKVVCSKIPTDDQQGSPEGKSKERKPKQEKAGGQESAAPPSRTSGKEKKEEEKEKGAGHVAPAENEAAAKDQDAQPGAAERQPGAAESAAQSADAQDGLAAGEAAPGGEKPVADVETSSGGQQQATPSRSSLDETAASESASGAPTEEPSSSAAGSDKHAGGDAASSTAYVVGEGEPSAQAEEQGNASAESADAGEATQPPDPEAEKKRAQAEAEAKKKQQRAERKRRKEEQKKRKRKKKENAYKDYFNFEESISKLPPHRILAINRGEKARVLRVKIDADQDAMREEAEKLVIDGTHPHSEFLRGCLKDALSRLIFPALEREVRRELTEKAEDHAVTVFARNLRKLLLAPPVTGHRVLAVDPGFRSGCKLAALDEFGNLHGHGAIYLVGPDDRKQRSRARLVDMIKVHKISVVAIGNGTACRETEQLVADALANELKDEDVSYVVVNEAGASVYSTSPVGREELGQYEAAQRSAVSIGRRLLDPLSELVKINPANIGVGLYQHDMKAKHLQDSLDAVVESCVNYVGVDLNTASPSLLRYVSGLNQLTARRLYEHRQQHGPFRNREQIKDVPGVGEATFVQAAGFLKIAGGDNPLDATWIHPESYETARQILEKLGCSLDELAAQVNATTKSPGFAEGLAEASSPEDAGKVAPEEVGTPESKMSASNAAEQDAPTSESQASESQASESQASESQAKQGAADSASASSEDAPAGDAPAPETARDSLEQAPVADGGASESVTGSAQASSNFEQGATEQAAPPAKEQQGAAEAASDKPTETNGSSSALVEKATKADPAPLARELNIGELLTRDILNAIVRPGRDPREDLPAPVFRREILKLEDLKQGMQLQGTVLNVVDFGAFVDIGLHDTGLVHISRLADRYIKDPHEVVGVGDNIDVWVMGIDKERRRVQLTAIKPGTEKPPQKRGDRRGDKAKRPPRRDKKDKDTAKTSGGRPSGKRRGKRDDRKRSHDRGRHERGRHERGRGTSKPFVLESKKEKKQKLTKAKKEGRAPLQTFGELAQFLTLSEQEEQEATAKAEGPGSAQHKPPEDAAEKNANGGADVKESKPTEKPNPTESSAAGEQEHGAQQNEKVPENAGNS